MHLTHTRTHTQLPQNKKKVEQKKKIKKNNLNEWNK